MENEKVTAWSVNMLEPHTYLAISTSMKLSGANNAPQRKQKCADLFTELGQRIHYIGWWGQGRHELVKK